MLMLAPSIWKSTTIEAGSHWVDRLEPAGEIKSARQAIGAVELVGQ
jgi:hypothetical protein